LARKKSKIPDIDDVIDMDGSSDEAHTEKPISIELEPVDIEEAEESIDLGEKEDEDLLDIEVVEEGGDEKDLEEEAGEEDEVTGKAKRKRKVKQANFKYGDHIYVPEIKVMDEQEISELLEYYDIMPVNLPRILVTDPCLMGLDTKPGDILKIERKSFISGISKYYRLVDEP